MTVQRKRKSLVGVVTSNKMDKTVVVTIERRIKHPVYGKYMKRTSQFYAHDPENQCKEGDRVRIMQSRPISRKKRWQLAEILD